MAPRKGSIPHNKLNLDPAPIRELYNAGLSTNNIGKKLGISKTTVKRIMKENGLTWYRFHRPGPDLSARAIKLYRTMSTLKVAEQLGTTHTTINSRLHKAGVRLRAVEEYSAGTSCDHHFFDKIDTPEKAYWLGMMITDGCVSHKPRHPWVVVLSLKAADADHVERFRQAIRCESANVIIGKVTKKVIRGTVSYTRHAALQIQSKEMFCALESHGVVRNKTGKTAMPSGIPAKLLPHFWRGCIDGDGWVALTSGCGKRRPQALLGLTGDLPLAEAWRAFCCKYVATRAEIVPNHNIWKFNVTDSYAVIVGQELYWDATVFLERKRRQFDRILDAYRTRTDRWGRPSKVARLINPDVCGS